MRVLVTGANGFVGRHLCAELERRGHAVVRAGHASHGGDVLPLDLHDALNVRGIVDVAQAGAVAHLAAQSFVPAALADPLTTFETNVGGTLRVLEAVRAADRDGGTSTRVLVVGSAEMYGPQPADAYPLRETCALHPHNPYAASKAAAEAFALAAAAAYAMDVVATRAFNHIGPGQDERFAVASFALQLARIAAGEPARLLVGNLEAQRDFLDVRDVVAAYAALLEKRGDAGTCYNVCSGRAVAMREILRQLVTIARVAVEIREDPARMRPSDMPLAVGEAARLRAATGWSPAYSLGASLRDVYADARERVASGG